jgi:hypothetical protein
MSVCHVLEAHFTHITLQPFFNVSSLMFAKLLIAHTMSRISDLLISSFGKPYKSSTSRSGKSFLHNRTSVTGFTKKLCPRYVIATNTVIFFL